MEWSFIPPSPPFRILLLFVPVRLLLTLGVALISLSQLIIIRPSRRRSS